MSQRERNRTPSDFQLFAQLGVIVDFAVEDDDRFAIFSAKGLIAAREIDDLQAHRAERDHARFVRARLVRSAMRHRARRIRDRLGSPIDSMCVNPAMPHMLYSYRSASTGAMRVALRAGYSVAMKLTRMATPAIHSPSIPRGSKGTKPSE